jgi:hypothetical protein
MEGTRNLIFGKGIHLERYLVLWMIYRGGGGMLEAVGSVVRIMKLGYKSGEKRFRIRDGTGE